MRPAAGITKACASPVAWLPSLAAGAEPRSWADTIVLLTVGFSAGCVRACWPGASVVPPAAGGEPAPEPASTMATTSPMVAVSPSAFLMPRNTPASGEVTSTFTLSVSRASTTSSLATCSPSCLSHLPIVTSLTDSPTEGTLISLAIVSLRLWTLCAQAPRARRIKSSCSSLWRLAEPAAGEALASRATTSRQRPPTLSPSRRKYGHAPMLDGSS